MKDFVVYTRPLEEPRFPGLHRKKGGALYALAEVSVAFYEKWHRAGRSDTIRFRTRTGGMCVDKGYVFEISGHPTWTQIDDGRHGWSLVFNDPERRWIREYAHRWWQLWHWPLYVIGLAWALSDNRGLR